MHWASVNALMRKQARRCIVCTPRIWLSSVCHHHFQIKQDAFQQGMNILRPRIWSYGFCGCFLWLKERKSPSVDFIWCGLCGCFSWFLWKFDVDEAIRTSLHHEHLFHLQDMLFAVSLFLKRNISLVQNDKKKPPSCYNWLHKSWGRVRWRVYVGS